jgi:RimJ/RimL family protein N-acetyltransferase
MNVDVSIDENISIRPIKVDDVEMYFRYGFEESSEEAKYYTGTTQNFTMDQIKEYVLKVVIDKTRRDYLIIDSNKIIGEAVLTDITDDSCHFRICIFNKDDFSRGIGSKVTRWILSSAFNHLGVKNVELEVFPFNKRGMALYEKIGFKITQRVIDEDSLEPYREIIIMKLNVDDFEL